MKRPYQITGVVLILFAGFVAHESLDLPFYTENGPGAFFFPLLVSILIGFLGVMMFLQATFGASEAMPADFFATRAGYLRIGAIVLALAAIVVLLEPLGFRLTMLVFLALLLLTLGRQNLLVTAVIALLGSFGTYYVFVQWLRTPLPVGMFGF